MIPEQPTHQTIAIAALTRFYNGTEPTDNAEIQRVIDDGIGKIKRDIMQHGKTWRPLMKTVHSVTVQNRREYPNPSDFEAHYTVNLLTGNSGRIAASALAGAPNVALDSLELSSQAEAEGKVLLMTAGAAAGQVREIKGYNPATKVCTLVAGFSTALAALDKYMIVRDAPYLTFISAARYEQFRRTGRTGQPVRFAHIPGDAEVGSMAFNPVPDAIYGVKVRYFADLTKLDMDSPVYQAVLRRWAGLFEQGVLAWKMQEDDDRYAEQQAVYQAMLLHTMAHDLVGFDVEKAQQAVMKGGA